VVRDRGASSSNSLRTAPRYLARRGGYTRIVKLGQRPGDAAPMSLLELIPDEGAPPAKASETKEPKAKGGAAKAAATSEAASAKPSKASKKAAASDEGAASAKKPAKPKSK
jgi:large subunit ribosomal protein L17